MPLSKSEISEISINFDNSSFTRGKSYYRSRKVLEIREQFNDAQNIKLFSKVLGNYRASYQQRIQIYLLDNQGVDIKGDCSCPVAYNCKHVAAVALSYFEKVGFNNESKSDNLNQLPKTIQLWLKEIERATNLNDTVSHQYSFNNNLIELLQSISQKHILIYLLGYHRLYEKSLSVECRASRLSKRGNTFIKGTLVDPNYVSTKHHDYYADSIDLEIAELCKRHSYRWGQAKIMGKSGSILLELLLQSGRCFWDTPGAFPLKKGSTQTYSLEWVKIEHDISRRVPLGSQNSYQLKAILEEGELLENIKPPMYIDVTSNTIGLAENEFCSPMLLNQLLRTPPVSKQIIPTISTELIDILPPGIISTADTLTIEEAEQLSPIPVLRLNSGEWAQTIIERISVNFLYGDYSIAPLPIKSSQLLRSSNEKWVRVRRDSDKEAKAIQVLLDFGFTQLAETSEKNSTHFIPTDSTSAELFKGQIWNDFIQAIPKLQEQGWIIDIDDSFSLQFFDSDYEAIIDDNMEKDSNINDWFSLKFDLEIEGKKLPLIPLLLPILEQDVDTIPDVIVAPIGKGQYARIPSQKLKPFLAVLIELFDRVTPEMEENIVISRFDLTLVNQIKETGITIKGGDYIKNLAEKIKSFKGLETVAVPDNLQARLRPYQQEGLTWLQFLREYSLNGILADDMGLGKTIQTLAQLLLEKQNGRLTQPALIVAPTSLMGNWRNESRLFTPDLNIIILQGDQRSNYFDMIGQSDIVLTTYPLLSRDSEILQQHQYHYLILDEAQFVKNHKTKAARLVRSLKFNHALCLTGTPMENHLGELWSMFDFLMPGFLGSDKAFKTIYRNPIEKEQDVDKRINLAKRIQPFLLRRTKDEVATELPEKTEIQKIVTLGEKQAAIYENIRITMDKRVRSVIASKGLARSHITILDALLKLRQVCCDPALLKLKHGNELKSAKLELLMQMLSELLAEGRKILLFSQFTSMLDIIEDKLQHQNINYTKLIGKTKNRDKVIEQFSNGEVDLFLISLKAGGVGLNLTQADTVILYDPWWNPAVEDQAVDRAHRIGQDKPVFIYKLVVENSVEEKMLAMQEQKRKLAKGIYSERPEQGSALIDEESLNVLFEPIH